MRRSILALAIGLAAQTPGALMAQPMTPATVEVDLSNFRFSPSELTLQHGRAYRLHIVNTSGGGHDFTAPEFFAASVVAPGSAVIGGKVKLTGKASADVVITPERAGTYQLRCSHFLHAGMGMTGRIVVE